MLDEFGMHYAGYVQVAYTSVKQCAEFQSDSTLKGEVFRLRCLIILVPPVTAAEESKKKKIASSEAFSAVPRL